MSELIEITGKLHFDPVVISKKHASQSTWKHVAIVKFDDDQSDDYYRWFLEKRYNLSINKPIRGFHLTVINDIIKGFSDKDLAQLKKTFEGVPIKVKFSVDVRSNGEHWWLKAYSKDAEDIRKVFNLNKTPYWNWHLTVGYVNQGNANAKGIKYNQMWEHSHYIHNLLIQNLIR